MGAPALGHSATVPLVSKAPFRGAVSQGSARLTGGRSLPATGSAHLTGWLGCQPSLVIEPVRIRLDGLVSVKLYLAVTNLVTKLMTRAYALV